MADTKPWELDYEEPKPWDLEYEKPETPPINPLANPLASRALGTVESTLAVGARAFNPFQRRSALDIITGGALPTPEVLSKPLVKVPPAVWETLPVTEAVKQFAPSEKAKAIATGVESAGTDTANFFTSPIGIATLGIGSLPAAAQRATALAFSAQMAKDVPEIAKQLGDELGKPEGQRDYAKISKLTANAIANTAFSALGAAHGLKPEIKPATEVAQPKETDASINRETKKIYGDVLSFPIEGTRQVPVEESQPRVQPQAEGGIPKEKEVTPAAASIQDIRPVFAQRFPQETLFQVPAWVDPGSAFDKALSSIRESRDEFIGKDVTGIWKSLTPEQRQDLAARGWTATADRNNKIILTPIKDALAARTYYGQQNRAAARKSATTTGQEKEVTPAIVDEPTGPGESSRFTAKLPEGYATGFVKEGTAELVGIEVEKAARRKGTGERLLRQFAEKAKQSGATSITGDFVPAAKALMDKVFGKPVSEKPVEDWPEGMGEPPIRSEYSIAPPKTETQVGLSEEALKSVGKSPTAEQLLQMTPEQSVSWKRANQYGPEVSKGIAEKLTPEQAQKLDAQRQELQNQSRDIISKLKPDDNAGMAKAMNVSLKAQTLREIGEDYAELNKEKPTAEPTETVLAARHGTIHGLPPGVPNRGPAFAADLMEASRQLGALVRSRATLRPGVLGQFVRSKIGSIKQADRIEVGDIQNQATVAHEIGHSLDGILFPQQNFGDSQASLADRVRTGTGKELAAELTKVSELMRGPMTGSAGHVAYRKRATELIADYFSLYAHDRDRAAAMAPKFTKGFEAVLAKDQNTAEVVNGLRAGNVIPKPPDPTLPKALAGITGTPPQPGTKIPGQVPAPPQLPPLSRERIAAVAAEGLVKDAIRTFESKVQKARIVGDDWRKRVPSQIDRNDVGAFVEGIGNLEKPGDTIDRVRTRMTSAKERLAKDYRFRQELERQEINKYLKDSEEGEYLKFLEDYLGHFYVDSTAKRQASVSRWAKESPHAKQRKLPTLKEAVDMGLTPITQDPAVTYELNSRINWQVATNRKFVANLKDIKTGAGQDVVVPAKDAPAGWEITNNPLIQRVYARLTPSGLMLWRGGAAIHPDVWRAASQILEAPISGDLGKAYDAVNGFTRANAFAFSLFHDLTLRSAALGSQAKLTNPLRGLFRVMEEHPVTGERKLIQSTRGLGKELLQNEEAVSDAALHGLKFSYTDSEAYQHAARTFLERRAAQLRDVPVLGKTSRLARDIQQWRQEGLWKNTHDAFKIITYHDLVSKALQDSPRGTDAKAVKENIASYLNDAYGGQEWQTKFWLAPGTRKMLSRFFLAPDWTLSTLRSVPGLSDVASTAREQAPRIAGREPFPTSKEGLSGTGKRLRFWGTEVAALAIATTAAQYAIYKSFGDDKKGDKPFPWDNELNQKMRVDVTPIMRKLPWHDPKDPTRHYVNLGKRPQEILNWFTEPDKQIMSKASRPVAIIFEQVSGSEGDFKAQWKQDHESFIESLPSRAKEIGTEALPFTFRGNQFALSAPVRKGMTKYKAQQAYESVFELAINPNRLKSLLRGQAPSEGTILDMTKDITDAAKRNGVPAEEVLKRSLSTVRGHHYNEFFKAFQKGDKKAMDAEAAALITLGATDKGLEESIRRRMQVQPIAQ